MNATGLLVLEASIERRGEFVQGPGTWGEKPEGIVMRAANRHGTHDRIRALGAEAQRPSSMPTLRCFTEYHRPFMQTKTAEEGRTGGDGSAKPQTKIQATRLCPVWHGHPNESVRTRTETATINQLGSIHQRNARARCPAPQSGETEGVIGEKEIFHWVWLAAERPTATRIDQAIGT